MGQTVSSVDHEEIHQDPVQMESEIPDDYVADYDGPFIQVLYCSQTTKKNSQRFALKLAQNYAMKHSPLPISVKCMDEFEPEHLKNLSYLVIVCSTFTQGEPPANGKMLFDWLNDAVQDFRIDSGSLSNVKYTVFGLGSSDYKQNFNAVGNSMKKNLKTLGAKPLCRHGIADFSNNVDTDLTPDQQFEKWALQTLLPAISKSHKQQQKSEKNQAGVVEQEENEESTKDADEEELEDENYADYTSDEDASDGEGVVDMEDMGAVMSKPKKTRDPSKGARKMLSAKQHATLTKQGYKIVGSHSAVKLCRWTKAMLRGRGGCYKHTMYGIKSYGCMEATPSVGCASRCVFCWRNNSHPAITDWDYQIDDPEFLYNNMVDQHKKMISNMKNIPGVKPERYEEALMPQHCALSLVGEPIMYPRINEYVELLHKNNISSFMVTNAQFPEQLQKLVPVTQLYLSIDSSSPEGLKAIDRPLYADFWERFIRSLELLKEKKQRTVYRLTLVQGQNMDGVADYARLVSMGTPTFIEVKGVTYCGNDELTMSNVPYHEQVRDWCKQLCEHLDDRYELACEHQHSCCILISDKKMKNADGKWNTWIDYPKFQELFRRWKETGEEFTDLDYSAETPDWATFDSKEAGFSPHEVKYKAKGKNRDNLKNKVTVEVNEGCCKGDNNNEGCCKTGDDASNTQGCCQKSS